MAIWREVHQTTLTLTVLSIFGYQIIVVEFAGVVLIAGQQIGSILDAVVTIRAATRVGGTHFPVFGFVLHAETVH